MTEPKQPSLLDYLDGLTRHLAAQLSAALLAGEVSAVHQSRVATRRMGAAMRLLGPVVDRSKRKKLERSLKKMRRRLGNLRDLDVMMDHLAELRVSAPCPNAIDWMQNQITQERDRAQREATDDIPLYKTLGQLEQWRLVRGEVQNAGDTIDHLIAQSLHEQMEAFARSADAIATPTPAEPDHASLVDEHRDPQEHRPDPHDVRIAGKSLRYTFEMADAAGHALPTKVHKSFKNMQDALGKWHDFVVLTESIMKRAADQMLAHHDLPLQVEVLQLATHVLLIAQKQLEKFNRQWREHSQKLQAAVRDAFPVIRDAAGISVTSPQTDPDPSGSPTSADPAEVP